MVTETRSARCQKKDDNSNSRSKSVGGKVKDNSCLATSGSTSGCSRSQTTSSQTLGRGTPIKKMRSLNPVENSSLSSSPDKRMSEREEKENQPSPLRRSKRFEKIGASSSLDSVIPDRTSSLMGRKKRKIEEEKEKSTVVVTKEQSEGKEVNTEVGPLLTKKRKWDARSYRSFLSPQLKITEHSVEDGSRMHQKGNSLLHEGAVNLGPIAYEELEGGAERSDRKEQGLKYSGQVCKIFLGPIVSKELEEDGAECSERKDSERKDEALKYSGEGCKENLGPVVFKELEEGGAEHGDRKNEGLKYSGEGCKENLGSIVSMELAEDGAVHSEKKGKALKYSGEGCNENLRPVVSKELEEGGAEFSDRKDEDEDVNYFDESCKEVVEESSSGSRLLAVLTLRNDGQSKKQRPSFLEANEFNDQSNLPSSSYNNSALQSSPVGLTDKEDGGGVFRREDDCEIDKYNLYSREQPTSLVAKRSLADDAEHICNFGVSRSAMMIDNLKYDSSVTPLKKTISIRESYGAESTSSFSSGGANRNKEQCREAQLEIQTDTGFNSCVVCKNPGLLLCCDGKGCRRSYHLSCLDPPLQGTPFGVWFCQSCVKKKMESGVYSVSEGIESVWDIKEEMQNEKHYFVKYKGLAHVHNCWIPESQILLEAPMLLAKFTKSRQKEKNKRWKQEWVEPHRLLQKRLLMPLTVSNENLSGRGTFSYSYHEWLVKWKGLGYEDATWEFENSPFLCSPEAVLLIKQYESRHQEAKKESNSFRVDKALRVKEVAFHKLSRLPNGLPQALDDDHLSSINRICEFWHMSKNTVLIDDQERILKTILFILSIQSHTSRPFLIVSTIPSLPLWEGEFARFAPSINLVVYSGKKDARKMIKALEFYEDGGCVMFQVLLSYPDVIFEDIEVLDCFGWEAVIVDECQSSRVSKHFEKLKRLSTDFRLLLLSTQLKDNHTEYSNLLSFLDSRDNKNCSSSLNFNSKNASGALAILKERLTHYLAYERKPDSSKFLEYWVPVQLSNVQLEKYCATLISNMFVLRSSSKIDQVGGLCDVLISTRKCCDHPYIVEPSLQSSLTLGLPEVEYLDIGVNASGKLLLLDKVLREIQNRGLRVLIFFQSIVGAGRDNIGDIIEDFLYQRFGADSYERVDSGLSMPRKLAALNMFNDRTRGRFVFLLENRACLPSTKLSSVDVVIIFDSDWNPLNDIRALQKISIDSQSEQVKVFRLYSCSTVEEKVLVFAKQDTILESNIRNISPRVSHALLSWGASYLFTKLDEFHQNEKVSTHCEFSTDKIFLNNVVLDLLAQLPTEAGGCITNNCSVLVKAQRSGTSYSRNIVLVGEKEEISSFKTDIASFWSSLLEGKHPQWRYISGSSQRIRKKVQRSDRSSKVSEAENEVKKKHRKVIDTDNSISPQTRFQDKRKGATMGKDAMMLDNISSSRSFNQLSPISPSKPTLVPSRMHNDPEASGNLPNVGSENMLNSAGLVNHVYNLHMSSISEDTSEINKPHMLETEERKNLRNTESSLHLFLKTALSKLYGVLRLPVDVEHMTENFLEYIMNNHRVSHESETLLQALSISLCWLAASFLKHKLDHKKSLTAARETLNFGCNENEVGTVYSKLQKIKRFSCESSALRDVSEVNSPGNKPSVSQNYVPSCVNINSPEKKSHISGEIVPTNFVFDHISSLAASDRQESEGDESSSDYRRCNDYLVNRKDQASVPETSVRLHKHSGSIKDELKKQTDLINITCSKREEQLRLKHQLELSDFSRHREAEKMKLLKARDTHLVSIRAAYTDSALRKAKVKSLNQGFVQKLGEFDARMKSRRLGLAFKQTDARNKLRQIKDLWLDKAKAGRETLDVSEPFDNILLSQSGLLETLNVSEHRGACDASDVTVPISDLPSAEPLKEAAIIDPIESIEPNVDFSEIPSIVSGPPEGSKEPIESNVKFSEIRAIAQNRGVGDIPVQTDTRPFNMNEEELVEPIGTPASFPPGVRGGITVEAESPPNILPCVLGDMPNGETEGMLVEIETSASQCNNMTVETEPPATIPPGVLGDMPNCELEGMLFETETSASRCNTMTVETESPTNPPGVLGDMPNGGTGGMLVETKTSASQCNGMTVETEPPATMPPRVLGDLLIGGMEGMLVETGPSASQCNNINQVEPDDSGGMPNGGTGGMLVETQTSASQCNNMTVEIEHPATMPPGVLGDMLIGGMEGMLVETGPSASQRNNINQVEPDDSGDMPNGGTGGMLVETQTSASQCSNMTVETEHPATMPPGVLGDMLIGGMEGMLVETGPSASQCNNINQVEPDDSGDMPNDRTGGMLVETQTSASQCNNMTVETEPPATVPPGVLGDMLIDRMEGMLVETGPSASQCNNINQVEPDDSGRTSRENPMTDRRGMTVNMPMETESTASQYVMNVVGSGTDTMLTISGIEQHRDAGTSDDAGLMTFDNASSSYICANCTTPNQGPSVSEHERLHDSCTGCDQGFSSPQQNEVPTVISTDVQVDPISNNPSASASIQLFVLPPSGSTHVSVTSEEEHCSTQQPELAMNPPVMANDQLASEHALSPELTAQEGMLSVNLRSEPCQTNYSAQQTEILSQQQQALPSIHHPLLPPPSIMPAQHEDLSNQPASRSHFLEYFPAVNWMPPQGISPEPLQNELMKIRKQKEILSKMQVEKELRLKEECGKEVEKVRRKYDALIQDAEAEFIKEHNFLEEAHDKVYRNQALAELFRIKFVENKGGASASLQGGLRPGPMQQLLNGSQPQQRPNLAFLSAPLPNQVTLPPPPPSCTSSRLHPSPTSNSAPPVQSLLLSNQSRSHLSAGVFPPPPRPNILGLNDPFRLPAPHLQRSRPQAGGMTAQQPPQLLASLGPAATSAPSPQLVPAGAGFIPPHVGQSREVASEFDRSSSLPVDAPSTPAATAVVYISDDD